jgi:hypothetical protein
MKLEGLRRAPGTGLQKRASFSPLIIGLTKDQTWGTYVAISGDNHSSIHYNLTLPYTLTQPSTRESKQWFGLEFLRGENSEETCPKCSCYSHGITGVCKVRIPLWPLCNYGNNGYSHSFNKSHASLLCPVGT